MNMISRHISPYEARTIQLHTFHPTGYTTFIHQKFQRLKIQEMEGKIEEEIEKGKENKTCKYIIGRCLQGHPGTILSMFNCSCLIAILTSSSGYAKI
jgi:hypothetical protein